MKKFCALFLPTLAAAAVLSSCGGGSGTDSQTMTLKDFAYGTKKINLTTFNVNYDINPTGLVNESQKLPEEETGQSIQVRGTMFGTYDVVFTYTVLSETEFSIAFGWTYEDTADAIIDASVASALGVTPDIYESGDGYKADLSGLQSTYSFDQSARTCTLESKWGSGYETRPNPEATQTGYTIIVK